MNRHMNAAQAKRVKVFGPDARRIPVGRRQLDNGLDLVREESSEFRERLAAIKATGNAFMILLRAYRL